MSRFINPVWAAAKANVWEVCSMVGLSCLLAGLWQVWTPLPWIIGGLLVLALGLWGSRAAWIVESIRKAQQR